MLAHSDMVCDSVRVRGVCVQTLHSHFTLSLRSDFTFRLYAQNLRSDFTLRLYVQTLCSLDAQTLRSDFTLSWRSDFTLRLYAQTLRSDFTLRLYALFSSDFTSANIRLLHTLLLLLSVLLGCGTQKAV